MFSLTVRRLIGAAAVVCLAASAVVVGSVAVPAQTLALTGALESTIVLVEPTRVLDTRFNIGLDGQFQSTVSRKLKMTGNIDTYVEATNTTPAVTTNKQVIPVGATGVVMNVTAVFPTAAGFLSIRPGDASGVPSTAGLNFAPNDVIPNGVTVAIPTTGSNAGDIDIHYGSAKDKQMHVIIDIVAYTTPMKAAAPARVLWVATSGTNTFPSLSAALASITDNSDSKPYVIKIAPGIYTETKPVELKDYVDVEGSGQDTTTITCACGSSGPSAAAVATVSADDITAEIRHLTIANTGTGTGTGTDPDTETGSIGVYTTDVTKESFSMLHVTATAIGGGNSGNVGVYNDESSPTMLHVTATATDGVSNVGVYNKESSPTMNHVTATADDGFENFGVYNEESSPSMNDVTATAIGGVNVTNYGVYNVSSSPTIRNSKITGTTNSIRNDIDSTAKVADTMLDGFLSGHDDCCSISTFKCVGVYNADFREFEDPSTCRNGLG